MDVSDSEEAFSSLLRVKLPPIQKISLRSRISFYDATTDPSYIRDAVRALGEMGITERVDLLDLSEKFNVSYVIDGTYRVVIGKVSDLPEKQALAEQIIATRGKAGECAVIDVSDLSRSTYRPVAENELFE